MVLMLLHMKSLRRCCLLTASFTAAAGLCSSPSARGSGTPLSLCDGGAGAGGELAGMRRDYSADHVLDRPGASPWPVFAQWIDQVRRTRAALSPDACAQACRAGVVEPNAMCLATCASQQPTSRFVLLKYFDER